MLQKTLHIQELLVHGTFVQIELTPFDVQVNLQSTVYDINL